MGKEQNKNDGIEAKLKGLSSDFSKDAESLAIILAAGHGKRIKSRKSKMLHEIWGVPTVSRVYKAASKGIRKSNVSIVVGVMAEEVAVAVGQKKDLSYAYQKEQNGTGHAVKIALDNVAKNAFKYCYVLPGDMGLISADKLKSFHKSFVKSGTDMMVLTGIYHGNPEKNYYGRIIRTKEITKDGEKSKYPSSVIEIKEYKDIMALKGDYPVRYKDEEFVFTKKELIEMEEFNSGVYVFSMKELLKYINTISSNNAQKELYLTDLIAIFNENGLSVGAEPAKDVSEVLGFNNKSVLKSMNIIARERVYEMLKDLIIIDDPEDFFIADSVVEEIIRLDRKGRPLDIHIGRGAHIGDGVKVNYGLHLHKNSSVVGKVIFGENVNIHRNASLSCFENQKMEIGSGVEILWGDIIRGRVKIADCSRIESSVRITGSDESPVEIGKNVLIKGTSYIYGSLIEDGCFIEHSIIKNKIVRAVQTPEGGIQKVRFVIPAPEGLDSLRER